MPPRVRSSLIRPCVRPARARGARAARHGLGRHDLDEDLERLWRRASRSPRSGSSARPRCVTWEQDTSPSTGDIVSDTFQTSPANDVANGVPGKVAEGWATVDRNAGARARRRPAGSQIAFGGHPLDELGRSADRADRRDAQRRRQLDAARRRSRPASGSERLVRRAERRRPHLRRRTTRRRASASCVNPSRRRSMGPPTRAAARRRLDGYEPKLARRLERPRVGRLVLERRRDTASTCSRSTRTTGQPIGTPALAPGSNDIDNNALRNGARLRRHVPPRLRRRARRAAQTEPARLLVDRRGAPTTIADLAGTGQAPAASSRTPTGPTGTSGWPGGTARRYNYELGDAKGAGGDGAGRRGAREWWTRRLRADGRRGRRQPADGA